jgi:DNA-directed RNA polymerase specialized sigma24 family protein
MAVVLPLLLGWDKKGMKQEHSEGTAANNQEMLGALDEGLRAVWLEMLGYARREIGCYARWRGRDNPVLADGFDAEGVVQEAFKRVFEQGIVIGGEDTRYRLRSAIKRRIRWLHERAETRLVVSEWDALPPRGDGVRGSVFDYLPGNLPKPGDELMRAEKDLALREFELRFEWAFRKRRDLLEVFRRIWAGQKRREIAKGLGAGAGRVKALQAQVMRRLRKFVGIPRGVAE